MINILMASCNGEKYIEKQIYSIIDQSESNWRLYISDDNSTDKSVEMIRKIIASFPNKDIRLFTNREKRRGVCRNFDFLLRNCEAADYYCFADQDDVWHKDKLKTMLSSIEEAKVRKGEALLVCHALNLIDGEQRELGRLFDESGLSENKNSDLKNLLLENHIPGCSMMINDSLKKLIGKLPDEILMHDWWFILVNRALKGRLVCIDKALTDYRLHGENQIGLDDKSTRRWVKEHALLKVGKYINDMKKQKIKIRNQAIRLLEDYGELIEEEDKQIIKRFICLAEEPGPKAYKDANKEGYLFRKKRDQLCFWLS